MKQYHRLVASILRPLVLIWAPLVQLMPFCIGCTYVCKLRPFGPVLVLWAHDVWHGSGSRAHVFKLAWAWSICAFVNSVDVDWLHSLLLFAFVLKDARLVDSQFRLISIHLLSRRRRYCPERGRHRRPFARQFQFIFCERTRTNACLNLAHGLVLSTFMASELIADNYR